jgi:glycosyltransferase involved in cell wall biosynthesis
MSTVLADFWYGRVLKTKVDMLDDLVATKPMLRLLCRIPPMRAVVLLGLARSYDAVVPNWYIYGRLFIVLSALFGRRNVVLFEVIDFGVRRGRLAEMLARRLLGPCFRRVVLGMQVMSRFECGLLAERYGLSLDRLHFVQFPLIWEKRDPLPYCDPAEPVVFSAGRGGCDWPTLFAAAKMSRWKLVVVCARSDFSYVEQLNADVGAEIYSDLRRQDYDALMARAALFVASLREERKSSGHIRFGHAIEAMVPTVISATACMTDYLIDGVTGAAVPPGDKDALAARIDGLLANATERRKLAESAFDHFKAYNKEEYFAALSGVLQTCLSAR